MEDTQVANLMKILNNTKIPKSIKKKVGCRSKKTNISVATSPVKDDSQPILNQILEGVSKLQRDLNNMGQEYVNLSGSFDAALTEFSSLKAENTDLRNKTNSNNEKIIALEQRIDDMEQHTENDEIIISGCSVKADSNNLKRDMSKLICNELKISLEVVKSLTFRKIGKGKHSVLVNVPVSSVRSAFCVTARSIKPSNLYKNECLISSWDKLLYELRKLKREKKCLHSVFSLYGRSYVKLTATGEKKLIRDICEADKYLVNNDS